MNELLYEPFSADLSDEAAFLISNFLYDAALAFESIYLGKIMRYRTSLKSCAQLYDKKTKKHNKIEDPYYKRIVTRK